MTTLKGLTEFLNDLMFYDKKLPVSNFDPHMANGLVYKSEEKISKIGFDEVIQASAFLLFTLILICVVGRFICYF